MSEFQFFQILANCWHFWSSKKILAILVCVCVCVCVCVVTLYCVYNLCFLSD